MNHNDQVDDLFLLFRDRFRTLHTIKPAIVTKVVGGHISCRPLTYTKYGNGTQHKAPELCDVPLFIYSANKGAARITVPVAVGDTVIVVMSDRDYGQLLSTADVTPDGIKSEDITPMGLYPICAFTGFFTQPSEPEVDTSSIKIVNGSTSISVAPSGNVTVTTGSEVNVNAPTTNFSGDVNVAGTMTATTDAIGGGISLKSHTHTGDSGGSTSAPN